MDLKKLAKKKVLLIEGISGVFHTPRIREGKFSSTGKTIIVFGKYADKPSYLETKLMLKRGFDSRKATTWEIYTQENYLTNIRANYDPANHRNTNRPDKADLPEQNAKVLKMAKELGNNRVLREGF